MHPFRTHQCGALSVTDAGSEVRLTGWVEHVRDLGRLAFATISDSSAMVQLVSRQPAVVEAFRALQPGALVTVTGQVQARRPQDVNAQLPTGGIEVRTSELLAHPTGRRQPSELAAALTVPALQPVAYRVLAELGYRALANRSAPSLTAALPQLDRGYRISELPVAEQASPDGTGVSSVLEVQRCFATLDDLRADATELIAELAGVLPLDPVVQAATGFEDSVDVIADSTKRVLLVAGLPAGGSSWLAGADRPLIACCEHTDAGVDALVVVADGRVVGAGGIRGTEPRLAPDPLLAEELADTAAVLPATGWLVLDLDRLRSVGGEQPESDEPAPVRAGHDLTSVLRAGRALSRTASADQELAAVRVSRADADASAAMTRSRSGRAGSRPAVRPGSSAAAELAGYAGIQDILAEFSMTAEVCDRLFELMPSLRERAAAMPAGELFEWLWSYLGAESVRAALLDSATFAVLQRCVELRVITSAAQLGALDQAALGQLAMLLHPGKPDELTMVLRQVLAAAPASATGLLQSLTDSAVAAEVERELSAHGPSRIVLLAEQRLVNPALLPVALAAINSVGSAESVRTATVRLGPQIYPNLALQPDPLLAAWSRQLRPISQTVAARADAVLAGPAPTGSLPPAVLGILDQLFRPVSLTYDQAARSLAETRDCCSAVAAAGLRAGGRHWSSELAAWQFGGLGGGRTLRLYLSKNVASSLAKASVGICTAGDAELFHRPDHHNLSIVDGASGIVVGNVQLHLVIEDGLRLLVIRAVNASTGYLTGRVARALVEAALLTCLELAVASDIDQVRIGEGLSYWHLDSSRPAIRAELQRFTDPLPVRNLQAPLELYTFGQIRISITKTYQLWDRARPGSSSTMWQGLEVVT